MLSRSLDAAPFFSLDLPAKQDFLINFLASLGYKVTHEGVCFGFGELLSEDFLSSGQFTAFFQRLALMHYRVQVYGCSTNYFKHFEQKQLDLTQQGRLNEAQAIVEELNDIRDFLKQLSEAQAPFYYPEQSEGRYLGQLQQCIRADMLISKSDCKKNKTCKTPYLLALHSKASFAELLRLLQTKYPYAFSMTLIINNHVMTLHHCEMTQHHQPNMDASEQRQWLYVDPNSLYDLAFKSDLEDISKAIFKQNTTMVFGISVKIEHQHAPQLETITSLLVANQSKDLVVSLPLLEMACFLGDLERVQHIFTANLRKKPHIISHKQVLTSMIYAAQHNHLSVVQYLLESLELSQDISNTEQINISHAALGAALKYGASDVITYLLTVHPEYLLTQNEAYNNQTLMMISATNHVSLTLVLERLALQNQDKKRQVLQAVDINQYNALYHARTNLVSFELLLNCYLSDTDLQKQLRTTVPLQNLIRSLIPHPAVLTLLIERFSRCRRDLMALKLAILESLPTTLAIKNPFLESHLILIACNQYQDALTPLLSSLNEDELMEHLQEKLGNKLDGVRFDDMPIHNRSYINVEQLSSFMSEIMPLYSELLLIEAILLFHPSRIPIILNLLSEDSLVELLVLKGTLGPLCWGMMNATKHTFPETIQKKLSEEKEPTSETLKTLSIFNYIKSLDVKHALSQIIYAKIQTSALLDRVKAHISWLEEPLPTPIEQDVELETFKTLIPKHQAMRTWFATCEPKVRFNLFQREGSLLFHAPHLFECILSDLPPNEQIAFISDLIQNPANYLSQSIGLRAHRALVGILSSEQAYNLLKNLLIPDPHLGIVLFFAMKKHFIALLCEQLNATQTHAILTQIIPPSGQTTLQILLGNPDDDSWCPSDLKLIDVLLKPLASNQARTLLMEHLVAFYKLQQREPEVYQLILSRLNEEDISAIMNSRPFLSSNVSTLGMFNTLIGPAVDSQLSTSFTPAEHEPQEMFPRTSTLT